MDPSLVGEAAALGTAFCWTLSILTFGEASRRAGSISVNLIRLVMAIGLLGLHGFLFRGHVWPADAPARTWIWMSASGFVGFFLGDLCLFRSVVLIGPRLSSLILTLAPPSTALVGALVLGERLTPLDWVGMAVTLAGIGWVVLERQPALRPDGGQPHWHPTPFGIFLAVMAALGQAFGLVIGKLGMGDYDPFAATQIRVISGASGFALLVLLTGWYPHVGRALRQGRTLRLILAGAVAGPYLGVGLIFFAVRTIPTGVAQTLGSLFPVLVIPFAARIYRERVSFRAVAGAVVAFLGVALLFLGPAGE